MDSERETFSFFGLLADALDEALYEAEIAGAADHRSLLDEQDYQPESDPYHGESAVGYEADRTYGDAHGR